ncbi:MAG: CotH kinase family protein [Oscillospiraceae bacterium]|nr:CotH kinase family protein [Oscillospiraceae bacterium]
MKRKLLAVVTLLAIMLSAFPLSVFAEGSDPDPDPEEGRLDLRLKYNGTVIDQTFNSFVSGGSITIEAGTRDNNDGFIPLPNQSEVEIYWTASDSGSGFTLTDKDYTAATPYTDGSWGGGGAGFKGVPIGTNDFITNLVFKRHWGGGSPMRLSPGTAAAPAVKYSSGITIPTFVEGDREAFTVSFVGYSNGPTAKAGDVARITRTFLLMPATGNPTGGNILSTDLINRRTDWLGRNGEHEDWMILTCYTSSHDLYDHNDGIFIPGKDREEWIEQYQKLNAGKPLLGRRMYDDGPRTRPDFIDTGIMDPYGPTLAANFNRRGRGIDKGEANGVREGAAGGAEIATFVEIFDANGFRQVAQGAGARVKGGWSRGTNLYEQKTFEFYARNGYNDYFGGGRLNSFYFPLFGQDNVYDSRDSNFGNMIHRYRRFRARNAGNDRDRAYMHDEVGQRLGELAGMPGGVQKDKPCVMYVNGAYYGMTFLKSPRTQNHYDRMYGGRESAFHTHGVSELGRDSCLSGTKGCGRIIPEGHDGAQTNANPLERYQFTVNVENFWWPEGATAPQRQNTDKMLFELSDINLGSRNTPAGGFTNTTARDTYVGWQPRFCDGVNRKCTGDRVDKCMEYWGTGEDICEAAGSCRARDDWDIIKDIVWDVQVPANQTVLGKALGTRPATSAGRDAGLLHPNGLTKQDNWDEFCARVDVDAFFHYYAIQIYWGNCDWPGNNMEMWRYFPNEKEIEQVKNGEIHPYLDGRWRPIIFDMDWGAAELNDSMNTVFFGSSAGYNTIKALIDRNEPFGGHFGAALTTTFLMRALMGGDPVGSGEKAQAAIPTSGIQADNRAKMANALSDLYQGAFKPAIAQSAWDTIEWTLHNEHQVMLAGNFIADPEYAVIGGKTRRINEVPRPSMQFGGTVTADATAVPGNVGRRWGTWPVWNYGPSQNADNDDSVYGMGPEENPPKSSKGVMREFLGDRAMYTVTTNDGAVQRRGGRSNVQGGIPSFVNASLGKTWTNGTSYGDYEVKVTVAKNGINHGKGTAKMNTRLVAVEDLPTIWNNTTSANMLDPRSEGDGTAVTGRYWNGTRVPITAYPYRGYKAVWSGTGVTQPTTTPCCKNTPEQNTIYVTGAADVTLNFVKCDHFNKTGMPIITGVRAVAFNSLNKDRDDWVEVSNETEWNNGRAVSLRGYYLTDSGKDFKQQLPSIIVRAGQRIYLPGSHNSKDEIARNDVFKEGIGTADNPILPFFKRTKENGFGISATERVRLVGANNGYKETPTSFAEDNELSRVEVPYMNKTQSLLRNNNGNFWVFNSAAGGVDWYPVQKPSLNMGFGAAEARARRIEPPTVKCQICGKGIDPDTNQCGCTPVPCTNVPPCGGIAAPPHLKTCTCGPTTSWTVGADPFGANVQRLDTANGGNVLALSNFDTSKSTITINFSSSASTSSRRICLWTNSSAGATASISYLTGGRKTESNSSSIGTANGWIRLNPVAASGDGGIAGKSITLPIPQALRNNASIIYIAITTDTGGSSTPDGCADERNHRGGITTGSSGGNEFNTITSITVS